MADAFVVKDSGERKEFSGGMVRDTASGKLRFNDLLYGPMLARWARLLQNAKVKYPDCPDGTPNWTKAAGIEEFRRFNESLLTHVFQLLSGDRSEDHAAAIYFNTNGREYVRDMLILQGIDPEADSSLFSALREALEVRPVVVPGVGD